MNLLRALVLLPLLAAGCRSSTPSPDTSTVAPSAKAASTQAAQAPVSAAPAKAALAVATGAQAPDFELTDLDGKTHKLSQYRGKRVVLEWFNPDCPFVKASHSKGSLKEYARKATGQGVVWLAINSSAPGKQGHGAETNKQGKESYKMEHPILLDPDGKVGKSYGAKKTPHLFVVDEKGVLVYQGAIDNSPDGEGQSPQGGTLVNYVEAALADLAAGRPVQTPETTPYGCGVKFM
jgi:peroxiredoxin